jgi:hypothetical protein
MFPGCGFHNILFQKKDPASTPMDSIRLASLHHRVNGFFFYDNIARMNADTQGTAGSSLQ